MAKAKKNEGSSKTTPASKTGTGKSAAKASSGTPLVDTSLAAQAAAKMLLARATAGTPHAQPPQDESSSFKQLKESIQKPHLHGTGNLLNNNAPTAAKRSNLPFGNKQVGHNQTFGADVNKAGVPRRTGG